ncbi:MAG: DinB family protein [Anaerolineae bacterium]
MLDFTPIRTHEMTIGQFTADLTLTDLRRLTDEMIDQMLSLIADCTDADVVFQPIDPDADDPYAADEEDVALAWTLGHVIVHVTASAEESAALAAEMARGVPAERRRSRYEVPWSMVTTIAQCRERLEESRRMRQASLAMWPDAPHLENSYRPWPGIGEINAVGRYVLGLLHDDDHLAQIAEIVRQAGEGPYEAN